jgi:hypothetical protein
MFQENGAWKEFGYQRSPRHTLFPFWLFAVTWAFISYVIATSVSWVMPVGAAVAYVDSTFMSTPVDEEEDEDEVEDIPVSRLTNSDKTPRQGYYVRDESIPADEMPRYIYHGPDKPE